MYALTSRLIFFFFFNDTATTEIYTLSLHDALPILASGKAYRITDLELASRLSFFLWSSIPDDELINVAAQGRLRDRKSTRLNSSHDQISYAVFCLKKKKKHKS